MASMCACPTHPPAAWYHRNAPRRNAAGWPLASVSEAQRSGLLLWAGWQVLRAWADARAVAVRSWPEQAEAELLRQVDEALIRLATAGSAWAPTQPWVRYGYPVDAASSRGRLRCDRVVDSFPASARARPGARIDRSGTCICPSARPMRPPLCDACTLHGRRRRPRARQRGPASCVVCNMSYELRTAICTVMRHAVHNAPSSSMHSM